MHPQLEKQIEQYLSSIELSEEMINFLESVNETYTQQSEELEAVERILEKQFLESQESHEKLRREFAEVSERFLFAKKGARIGVWDWNPSRDKLVWDEEMFELYGVDSNDFGGRFNDWVKVSFPEDFNAIWQQVEASFYKGGSFEMRLRANRPDGVRIIQGMGHVWCDEDEIPVRIIGVNWDVTDFVHIQEELKKLNEGLETKVSEAVAEVAEKERMLLEQSRLAIMGEMIGNIAHQWRQPLNAVGIMIQDVQDSFAFNELDANYLENFVQDSMKLINYMSRTIDDFRNFFKPNVLKEQFSPAKAIAQSLELMSASLSNHGIEIEKNLMYDGEVEGYVNQYSQVVINILNNARDILLERTVQNPKITITLDQYEGKNRVQIKDNAGGIPEDIVTKVFDPYFTTKHKSQGTGLGLYMSKMIIEKNMGGYLSVANEEDGAIFTILI